MFVSLLEAAEARGLNLGGLGGHGRENKRNSNFESTRISPEAVLCFHPSLPHRGFYVQPLPLFFFYDYYPSPITEARFQERTVSRDGAAGGCFYMQNVSLKNGNKQRLLGVKLLTLQWRVILDSAPQHLGGRLHPIQSKRIQIR